MRPRPIQDQSGRNTFRRRSRIALKCLACALTRVSACSIAVAATIASPARRPVAAAYSSRNRNEPAFDPEAWRLSDDRAGSRSGGPYQRARKRPPRSAAISPATERVSAAVIPKKGCLITRPRGLVFTGTSTPFALP